MIRWCKVKVWGVVLTVPLALTLVGCASTEGVWRSVAQLHDPHAVSASRSVTAVSVAAPAAPWPTARWWTRYGDPQLDALVDEVLASNPTLQMADARVRQAFALAGVAQAEEQPSLSAGFKSTRQRYSGQSTIPRPVAGTWQTYNDTALNLVHDLDFWGRQRAAAAAALGRAAASEVEARAARLMLTAAVVQGYLRLAQAHDQLALAERVLQQREALLALTRQRVNAGIDSEVELQQAVSALPAARQQAAAAHEAIALAGLQLGALTGQGPDRGVALAPPQLRLSAPIGLPSTVPAEWLGRRPDVVAQRWRVETAQRDVDVARAQFYPNVSLVGWVGLQSLGLDRLVEAGSRTAGIGPAITLPLFDGGRLRGQLGVRNAAYDLAVEQYNQVLIDALHDVLQQLTGLHWVDAQRREQALAVQSAQTAYDLALQRYRAGVGSYLQLLATESQVLAQRRGQIDLEARALQLDASLLRALGGGTLSDDAARPSKPLPNTAS